VLLLARSCDGYDKASTSNQPDNSSTYNYTGRTLNGEKPSELPSAADHED
jgi:hypothetical protein